MRTRLLECVMLLAGIIFPPALSAQDYTQPAVTLSKEMVRSDGKVYWAHPVLEKQTLFSISKAYGVTLAELYDANPGLRSEGLKNGSVLLIPVKEADADVPSSGQVPTEAALVAEGSSQESPQQATWAGEYQTHVVKWYEDLESIAEKYGVPAQVISDLNSLKPGKKLKNRTKLKIPVGYVSPAATAPASGEDGQDPGEGQVDGEDENGPGEGQDDEEDDSDWRLFSRKSSVSASLILPLGASGGKPSEGNMDFYSGVLLAVRDLAENEGISTDLSVFDCASSMPVTAQRIRESDLVIGPVSPADLNKILSMDTGDTPIISPLDQRAGALVTGHEAFIQAPASYDAQWEDMVSWLARDKSWQDRIIVISDGARSTYASALDSLLSRHGLSVSRFSYDVSQGRGVLASLQGLMTQDGVNRIVISSENEGFVNDVVRNLVLVQHGKFEVVLYAPARIRSYDTIDVENLHSLRLHCSASYYIDYDDARVRKFLMTYRALFNAEPTQFSFQGYDVATFFIRSATARRWTRHLASMNRESLLQSDFLFTREDEGGLENMGTRRIVYENDYSIKLIR